LICRFQNPEPEVGAQVPAQQQCQDLRLPVTTETWVSLGSKTLCSCCPPLQESYRHTETERERERERERLLQHSCVLDSQRNKYRKQVGGNERDAFICIVRELPVACGGLGEMKFGRSHVAPPSHKPEVLHTFVVREDKTGAR
jgi:hypothetical protein